MIPEAAVEAAARRMALDDGGVINWVEYKAWARKILEAAAPHMLAGAFDHGRSVQHYTSVGWSIEDAIALHADKTPENPYRPTP